MGNKLLKDEGKLFARISCTCSASRGFHLPLLDLKIPFLSIFKIAYLYLPRDTYVLP